jgi:hypothetical protein
MWKSDKHGGVSNADLENLSRVFEYEQVSPVICHSPYMVWPVMPLDISLARKTAH